MPDVYATIADVDPATQERLAGILELRAADPVEATKAAFLNDMWLGRRLPTLLSAAGFEILNSRSYGYVQTSEPEYILSLVDRGADTLVSWGRIEADLGDGLKAEARRRVETGTFFGFIGFISLIARRPG